MSQSLNILVNKLNRFKNKYYTFKFVKGILLTIFFLLLIFTIFSIAEYFIYLSSEVRKVLFFGFILFGFLLTIQLILLPLLRMSNILKPIDTKASSGIIQKHFADLKDKLINVIELSELGSSSASKELVVASIDQKISELNVFDFSDAVKFKNLKTIFFSFLISLVVTGLIYGFNKSIYTTASKRIIDYNTQYIKPAPYVFNLLNKDLKVHKGDAIIIEMESSGNEIPGVVYINIDGNNYLMKNREAGIFEFKMSSVINPFSFFFTDLKYQSQNHAITLLPKPGISKYDVEINPPSYTKLPVLNIENIGDLQVPLGSEVQWHFDGHDIDSLYFVLSDSTIIGAKKTKNSFHVEHYFYESKGYHVYIENFKTDPLLTLSYTVDVIPDNFPDIKVTRIQDSLKFTRFYFKGTITDDYGFSDLHFHFNYNNKDSIIGIPFIKSLNDQDFYFSFDFEDLQLSSGSVSYYFSVSDNDAVNGHKTTTSDHYIFTLPDSREIAKNENEQFDSLERLVKETENIAKDIQSDLKNLRLKNMDTNVSDWEKSEMVKEILSKQSKLEKLYEQIKRDNEQLNRYTKSFNEQNEKIVEKQKQVEKLLDEVFTDELKKLLEEFQQLAQEFNSNELNRLTQQLNLTYEDLQKQLDRNLEMLRKMKVEQKLQNVIDEMQQLADEEEQLADEFNEDSDINSAQQQIDQHKNQLENLRQQLDDALNINNELERQLNYDDFKEEFDDINNSLEDSKKAIEKDDYQKAGESIKKSSQKMKSTAQLMQQMLDSNEMKQNMENIHNLKQILSNLLFLSFEQEDILTALSTMHSVDPALNELNRSQKRIKDQSRIVKDSLYALAKRTPQINSMVNNELLNMELHLDKAIDEMGEGLYPNARSSQQYVMTAANNLALLLNEAMENLEEQMANAQPGNLNDSKQNGKEGMNLLREQADNIKEQLQKMIDQLKQGISKNMSQQFGQSLMQHEMMQKMLREIMNNGGIEEDTRKTLQQVDNILEQNREQLMNKNIDSEMISRQNLINTRLLDAENAELEREYEERREGKTADDYFSNPVEYFENKERHTPSIENLNRNAHKLSKFYINKYKQYLNNMHLSTDD